jgi:hypothetical protein
MGSVHPLQASAANDMGMPVGRPLQVAVSRFVTIELASTLTGLTEGAIRMKITKGVWLEDRQWVKRDGRVLIDMRGYETWCETGKA